MMTMMMARMMIMTRMITITMMMMMTTMMITMMMTIMTMSSPCHSVGEEAPEPCTLTAPLEGELVL